MAKATKHTSPVDIEARKALGMRSGDMVRVWQKIKEGDKTRLQVFEGLIIARKHGSEPGATFTVRKTTSGVGVEKIFPLYAPTIDKIEIVSRSKARRAKLYYIRDKASREVRKKLHQVRFVAPALVGEEVATSPEPLEKEEKADNN